MLLAKTNTKYNIKLKDAFAYTNNEKYLKLLIKPGKWNAKALLNIPHVLFLTTKGAGNAIVSLDDTRDIKKEESIDLKELTGLQLKINELIIEINITKQKVVPNFEDITIDEFATWKIDMLIKECTKSPHTDEANSIIELITQAHQIFTRIAKLKSDIKNFQLNTPNILTHQAHVASIYDGNTYNVYTFETDGFIELVVSSEIKINDQDFLIHLTQLK